jgi:hypothetical protein
MKTKSFLLAAGVVLAMAFTFGCSLDDGDDGASASYGWYGKGSATNYTISTVAQLKGLADIVRGKYGEDVPPQDDFTGKTITLTADINLDNQEWTSIGYSYLPLYPFNGTFDGDNKTISGLNADNQGFFGLIGEHGIVKNIIFDDFNASGYDGNGGLARTNRGIIQNISITNGTVSGSISGGVVGFNYGTVENVSFSGAVSGYGGIAAYNYSSGIIRDCNFTGTVSSGKLVGTNYDGTVENCLFNETSSAK